LLPVFDQYLHYKGLPQLEIVSINGKLYTRWFADAKGFNMPVKIRAKGGEYHFIKPTERLTPINIDGLTKDNLEVDTFNFYIGVLVE